MNLFRLEKADQFAVLEVDNTAVRDGSDPAACTKLRPTRDAKGAGEPSTR